MLCPRPATVLDNFVLQASGQVQQRRRLEQTSEAR
jgi:hypothetical protein